MPVRSKAKRPASGYPGQLRIIGGRWRGRRLPVPQAPGLRPTPDRVRETLFNWLAPYLEGSHCLDLFAGSGALCLEALSRGAAHATLVEKATHVVAMLRQNIETLKATGAEVRNMDAVAYLEGPVEPVDILFLDPPFAAADLIGRCAEIVEARGWVKPGGFVYIEAPSRLKNLPLPPTWEMVRSKIAGQVGYHLTRRLADGKAAG
ncbi:MAG: 16S rRNA (guanine(966)-N(2))-methyltransferase RsmD [Gammaproteobacteria bacterium]|nr:MAG: 16S rRNA (guanine(966)-N(2))-methyltransferase RsmD [Gammaproteobacteria bacterium]